MDLKKIGGFLKELRKEKGLTQEQLAEILGVSGRTVSRWETGSNMPDLSILIELADYYDVEMKEILDGERKSETMEKELKETLCKVADYSEMEKERAAKAGNLAFGIMFGVCAAAILIQLLVTGNLLASVGETAALLLGGLTYIGLMVHYGIWTNGSGIKSTPLNDAVISILCSAVFTAAFIAFLRNSGAEEQVLVRIAILFFTGITIAGFGVLRALAFFSNKRKNKLEAEKGTTSVNTKNSVQPVRIFIADGSMQADMVLEALKRSDIPAYKQDLGTAGFDAVRYGMGRLGDDRVAIYTADHKADDARQVISGMGLEPCEK